MVAARCFRGMTRLLPEQRHYGVPQSEPVVNFELRKRLARLGLVSAGALFSTDSVFARVEKKWFKRFHALYLSVIPLRPTIVTHVGGHRIKFNRQAAWLQHCGG